MKTCKLSALEKIFKSELLTIQGATLTPLSHSQKVKLYSATNRISYHLGRPSNDKVSLVFRGDNFSHLSEKLSSFPGILREEKMLSLLFYFGDKAKHYYKYDDEEIANSRWIKNIEDLSRESAKEIFKKTRKVIKTKRDDIFDFRENNTDFVRYFEGDNIDKFSNLLVGNSKLRDYYLYFLHTSGKIGIGDKSLLVSTSLSYDIARQFSGENGTKYIIYYVIPSPINNFAITPYFTGMDKAIKNSNSSLPIYNGKSLYPEQHEVAIKGALFAHHMLGVMVLKESNDEIFIANPHMFSNENSPSSILKGLTFDQSDFKKRLGECGYSRGVGTFLDGNYSTIWNRS